MIGILIDNITENAWETFAIEEEFKKQEINYTTINIHKLLMDTNRHKPEFEVAVARLMMGTGYRLQSIR